MINITYLKYISDNRKGKPIPGKPYNTQSFARAHDLGKYTVDAKVDVSVGIYYMKNISTNSMIVVHLYDVV